jgi:G3E family GTPase
VSDLQRLPVVILTGFLGSGKTTLLNRLVGHADFRDSAVLINEFGEIGLDHHLVMHSADRLVVLAGGCVCCAMREDVEGALRELFDRRDRGQIPAFERIIIETTGLADPVPLLLTLQTFGLSRSRLQPARVITTVDAALNARTVEAFTEAPRQIAAADVVLITKTDRVEDSTAAMVRERVKAINPWCRVTESNLTSSQGDAGLREVFASLQAQSARPQAVWQRNPRGHRIDWAAGRYTKPAAGAGHQAGSFSISLEEAIDWGSFGVWLTLLLHRHGERVLRVKGIVNVAGLTAPVVFHAAQHMVHPPEHLQSWPCEDRRSHIVFIVLGLDPDLVLRSLTVFNRLAAGLAGASAKRGVMPAGAGGTVAGRPIRRPTAPSWIRG